jgi:hypothetical protein
MARSSPEAVAMRTTSITAGSITDIVNGVAAQLKGLDDLVAIERSYLRLHGALQNCAVRAATVQRHGGRIPGLAASAWWLDQVIHDHPGLADPAAEGLRSELLRLVDRVRLGR